MAALVLPGVVWASSARAPLVAPNKPGSSGQKAGAARGDSGGKSASAAHAGRTAPARDRKSSTRPTRAARNGPVELYSVNNKETLQLRLRDTRGRALRGVQKRFDRFLRCHYTNKIHSMNPRLVRLLYQVGQHYPGRRLEVVSGYRHPTVAKNPHSPHMQGLACDFRVPGIKNAELRDYLRAHFEKVGVGYYPNSSFVHLDVRKDRSAFWIDYSRPGDRSIYSETPYDDLKTGRAETYKPTKIDTSWVTRGADGTEGAPAEDSPPPEGAPAAGGDVKIPESAGVQSPDDSPGTEPGSEDN